MARFESEFNDRALLLIVRTVADSATDGRSISQRRWDAAREGAGHGDAPHAAKICDRLGMAWHLVLDLAFSPPESLDRRLGRLRGEEEADWLTDEHAVYLMKVVARRLGTSSLSRAAFRREMVEIKRTAPDGTPVPNEDQLITQLGGWDAACAAAGLQPQSSGGTEPAATGIEHVLERCYEGHGTEPTSRESEDFARANGIPYPRRTRPWAAYVADWKRDRAARGLLIPDGPPAKNQRPDYTRPIGGRAAHGQAGEIGMRRRAKDWKNQDACVAAVAGFLGQLRSGEKDSRKAYVDWSTGRSDAPPASALDRHHGGYAAVRAKARRRPSQPASDMD